MISTASSINDGSADLHDSVIKICDNILKDDDELLLDDSEIGDEKDEINKSIDLKVGENNLAKGEESVEPKFKLKIKNSFFNCSHQQKR